MSDEKRNLTSSSEIDVTPKGPVTIDGESQEKLPTNDKGYRKLATPFYCSH